jgi:hypothetical protein
MLLIPHVPRLIVKYTCLFSPLQTNSEGNMISLKMYITATFVDSDEKDESLIKEYKQNSLQSHCFAPSVRITVVLFHPTYTYVPQICTLYVTYVQSPMGVV